MPGRLEVLTDDMLLAEDLDGVMDAPELAGSEAFLAVAGEFGFESDTLDYLAMIVPTAEYHEAELHKLLRKHNISMARRWRGAACGATTVRFPG